MRRIKILTASLFLALPTMAQQTVEGTSYCLPKTALRVVVRMEKTTYTPGDFAVYSERFLKESAPAEASVTYRMIGTRLETCGVPDTANVHVARMDSKLSISGIDKDDSGILIAVNATGNKAAEPVRFKPAPKEEPLSPRDYMTQDILAAGSTAKMAELTALEIYDIRDSRNMLNRGQADFMPQDGEQLKIMLNNLDTQERALTQLFTGRTVRDTTEAEVLYVPEKETERDVLFRFSAKMGMVDKDDLAGAPYYIRVEDLGITAKSIMDDDTRRDAAGSGVWVNMPGKVRVTLLKGAEPLKAYELYAAQFGYSEELAASLFNKKFTTSVILSPITGNAEHVETVSLK